MCLAVRVGDTNTPVVHFTVCHQHCVAPCVCKVAYRDLKVLAVALTISNILGRILKLIDVNYCKQAVSC